MPGRTPPPPANLAELFSDPEKVRQVWQVVWALENLQIVVVKDGVRRNYALKLSDFNAVIEIDVS